MLNKNKPIRHHYIPQFILRNFSDRKGNLNYWDNISHALRHLNTSDVFMNKYMYTSKVINQDNDVEVENNLSKFECDVAPLFKKIVVDNIIVLTRSELEKLRIFLSLLSFRSDSRKKQYKKERFDNLTKSLLKGFKENDSFEEYWKREVNELAKCRTYDDIKANKVVDDIVLQEFLNDIEGYYMTIVESRGQDFIISDTYPTSEVYTLSNGVNIHMHMIFPVSPKRAILLHHIMFKEVLRNNLRVELSEMVKLSKIKDQILKEPKPHYVKSIMEHTMNDTFEYSVVKIYQSDVCYLNELMLNEVVNGFAYKDYQHIEKTLFEYHLIPGIKNDHKELLDKMMTIVDKK